MYELDRVGRSCDTILLFNFLELHVVGRVYDYWALEPLGLVLPPTRGQDFGDLKFAWVWNP